jgi:hypothetical protein
MSQWGWVILGWSLVVGVLAVYAATLVYRARVLSARVAPERRRWMSAPDAGRPS